MTSRFEVGLDAVLERCHAELIETYRLAPGAREVRELGERRAAPQIEGRAQRGRAGAGAHASLDALERSLKAARIQLHFLELNGVSGGVRVDGAGPDGAPEACDVHVERGARSRGWALVPKLVEQLSDGNDPARVHEQHHEQ